MMRYILIDRGKMEFLFMVIKVILWFNRIRVVFIMWSIILGGLEYFFSFIIVFWFNFRIVFFRVWICLMDCSRFFVFFIFFVSKKVMFEFLIFWIIFCKVFVFLFFEVVCSFVMIKEKFNILLFLRKCIFVI